MNKLDIRGRKVAQKISSENFSQLSSRTFPWKILLVVCRFSKRKNRTTTRRKTCSVRENSEKYKKIESQSEAENFYMFLFLVKLDPSEWIVKGNLDWNLCVWVKGKDNLQIIGFFSVVIEQVGVKNLCELFSIFQCCVSHLRLLDSPRRRRFELKLL